MLTIKITVWQLIQSLYDYINEKYQNYWKSYANRKWLKSSTKKFIINSLRNSKWRKLTLYWLWNRQNKFHKLLEPIEIIWHEKSNIAYLKYIL